MKDGVRQRTQHLEIPVNNECVDVVLAGIRIKIDYLDKAFFVGVGTSNEQFSGRDCIPIGKLYDALRPLAKREN